MSQPAAKVKYTENNNQPQGRSGGKVKRITGPAVGKTSNPNPTKNGGIYGNTKKG